MLVSGGGAPRAGPQNGCPLVSEDEAERPARFNVGRRGGAASESGAVGMDGLGLFLCELVVRILQGIHSSTPSRSGTASFLGVFGKHRAFEGRGGVAPA
jgi:hypothetical protein